MENTAAGIDPPSTLIKKTEHKKVNKMKRLADKGMSVRSKTSFNSTEVKASPGSLVERKSTGADFYFLILKSLSGSTKILSLAGSLGLLRGSAGWSIYCSIFSYF
jgi:hypothetical protein